MKMTCHPFRKAVAGLSIALLALGPDVFASGEQAADAPPKSGEVKPSVAAAEPAPSNEVMRLGLVVQPSLFVDNYSKGVDPFHPKSRRRHPASEAVAAVPDAEITPSGRIEQLSLKGIAGQGAARLALINNRSFAAGESGGVRIPGGQMQIRVLELGERSVKIRIDGDPKTHEIKLDDRTYDFTQTR